MLYSPRNKLSLSVWLGLAAVAFACSASHDGAPPPAPQPAADAQASSTPPPAPSADQSSGNKPSAGQPATPPANAAPTPAPTPTGSLSNIIASLINGSTGTAAGTAAAAGSVPPIDPGNAAGNESQQFVAILNQQRAARNLPPVAYDVNLTARCLAWSQEMASTNVLSHDPSVYGTPERECVAWDSAGLTPLQAYTPWEGSPPHNAAMFDNGYPTAVKAGYAQTNGYGCLRLCPAPPTGNVCN